MSLPVNPENPYAVAANPPVVDPPQLKQVFRHGEYLILHKDAQLPDRCVKSNQPTNQRLLRRLTWHHPALYLLIFVGVLIYIIVALIVRQTVTINLPLAARYKSRRLRWMALAWSMVLCSLAVLWIGIAQSDNLGQDSNLLLPFLFIAALFIAALIGIYKCRVVYPKRIADGYVWLGGVCEEFRREYPEWPYST